MLFSLIYILLIVYKLLTEVKIRNNVTVITVITRNFLSAEQICFSNFPISDSTGALIFSKYSLVNDKMY